MIRSIVGLRQIGRCGGMSWSFCAPYSSQMVDPPSREPWIPEYPERKGEPTNLKRARLLYQSRKRGMLENCLLLSTFAKKYLDAFNEEQLEQYDRLINRPSNDWELFYWAVNVKETPKEYDSEVMAMLKEHAKNTNKENRCLQPDLY